MKFFFALLIFCCTTLFGGSLRIVNDSPFLLQAEIIAADGSRKGKVALKPKEQVNWQDDFSGASTWSQTPYTVIFTCKDGKQFGVLSGVQQGATITALSSTGDRYCQPPKKQDQEKGEIPKTPSKNHSSSGSVGPADPMQSPSDPNWGPP